MPKYCSRWIVQHSEEFQAFHHPHWGQDHHLLQPPSSHPACAASPPTPWERIGAWVASSCSGPWLESSKTPTYVDLGTRRHLPPSQMEERLVFIQPCSLRQQLGLACAAEKSWPSTTVVFLSTPFFGNIPKLYCRTLLGDQQLCTHMYLTLFNTGDFGQKLLQL